MTEEQHLRIISDTRTPLWIACHGDVLRSLMAYPVSSSLPPWDQYKWYVHRDIESGWWIVSSESGFAVRADGESAAQTREDALRQAEARMAIHLKRLGAKTIIGLLEHSKRQAADMVKERAETATCPS